VEVGNNRAKDHVPTQRLNMVALTVLAQRQNPKTVTLTSVQVSVFFWFHAHTHWYFILIINQQPFTSTCHVYL
jgi:hypothetical protein